MATIRERCLTYLAEQRIARTTSDIAYALGEHQKTVGTVLGVLFNEGRVQRSRSGGRNAAKNVHERQWRIPPLPSPHNPSGVRDGPGSERVM